MKNEFAPTPNTNSYGNVVVGSEVMFNNEIYTVYKVYSNYVALYKDGNFATMAAFNLINPI